MLKDILPYEKDLFFLINGSHSYFTDCTMWLLSTSIIWIPLAIFLTGSIVYKKSWKIWLPILITISILFLFCDQFSSAVCKPYFARLRPTHYPGIAEHVRTLYGYVGGQYGFISGHATNSLGFATLTALLFRNKLYSIAIYIWALLISYSRIYLGVHFVSDVVVGALAGISIGFLTYKAYRLYLQKYGQQQSEQNIYSKQQTTIVAYVLITYTVTVSLFGEQLISILRTNPFFG